MYETTTSVIFNPFPGLRAFEESDEHLFFGRERQVDELLEKLSGHRFLAVIGTSGSGKSSLVKSGLLPSLHGGFMATAGSSWKIAVMRPGNDPIGNLAAALSNPGLLHDDESMADTYRVITETTLRRSKLGLTDAVKEMGARDNILIVVDQFEELFRFNRYERESQKNERDSLAFNNLLLEAAQQDVVPIYIVITMRSDFLGNCTELRGLPEAINKGLYLVPRLTREEVRSAITGPVAVGGASISSLLVTRLLNDVGDNPDQLPILQHALMRTWQTWQKEGKEEYPVDVRHYESTGTMAHALSQHAEEAYEELASPRLKDICEAMFRSLTEKRPDTPGTRRPTTVRELALLAGASEEEVKVVIEVFRDPERSFLMPPAGTELEAGTIIDISHESLMRVWDRLAGWVEEEAESADIYLRLCQAARLYNEKKAGLYRDPELGITLRWRQNQSPNETWGNKYNNYFAEAMKFLEESEAKQVEERAQEESAKRKRRRKSIVLLSIGILMLCGSSILVALFVQSKMEEKTKAVMEEIDNARTNSYKALHLAGHVENTAKMLSAANLALSAYDTLEYYNAILHGKDNRQIDALNFMALDKIFWSERQKNFTAFGDKNILAVATMHRSEKVAYSTIDSLYLLSISLSGEKHQYCGAYTGFDFLDFDPGDRMLAACSTSGRLAIFNAAGELKLQDTALVANGGTVVAMEFIKDDQLLVASKKGSELTIERVSVPGCRITGTYQVQTDSIANVVMSGGRIAVAGRRSIELYDLSGSKPVQVDAIGITGKDAHTITSMAYSNDGKWITWGDNDGDIYIYDVTKESIQEPKELERAEHVGHITSQLFYTDPSSGYFYLSCAGADGLVYIVEVDDAVKEHPEEDPLTISSDTSAITGLACTSDGRMLIAKDNRSLIIHFINIHELAEEVRIIRDSLQKVVDMQNRKPAAM